MNLRARSIKRKANIDPIILDQIDSDDEWIAEKTPELPVEDDWLEEEDALAFDISAIENIGELDSSSSRDITLIAPPSHTRKRKSHPQGEINNKYIMLPSYCS